MSDKTAIIIGAGPAGLTAAYELLDRTSVTPVIFEMTGDIGGISKTVDYKGNRIDIGGHRFFSKSDRVMQWWQNLFPLQGAPARDDLALGRAVPLSATCLLRDIRQQAPDRVPAPDPEKTDAVMLVRGRCSRIFFLRRFFDYPVTLSLATVKNLGLLRIVKIGLTYMKVRTAPVREERSLEDFFINRFGLELYRTFFRDYTEKVWGVPCREIKPEWGAQRIKGLSVTKTLLHAARKLAGQGRRLEAKKVETSLIEQFYYPKLGPGQIWEEAAARITRHGGRVVHDAEVIGIEAEDDTVCAVIVRDKRTGVETRHVADYFFSSMPVRDLVAALGESAPAEVREVAQGLRYRDFITVGLLLKRLAVSNETGVPTVNDVIPDNWIYIQEREVKLGRLQIFNNWSPYLVRDPDTVWVGLEYFCDEGDRLWNMPDAELSSFAADELASLGIIERDDVLDSVVLRVPKAYPAYFGSYDRFDVIRNYTDRFENLFLIGRNGMHRYNNADHSMLTAMAAVENIIGDEKGKKNIWSINAEEEYHEEKKA